MHLSIWNSAVVVLYFALMGWVSFLTRRTKTFEEYAVGKHAVPAMMVFASLAATIIGPGFSFGVTGKSWNMGFLFYFLILGYAVQLLVNGVFFAPRLSLERDCNTLGDVMRKRYGRLTHLLVGLFSITLCIGGMAFFGKVGGTILHDITGWPFHICLITVIGTTALFTFSGGMQATIATEGIQFAMKAIVLPLMLLLAVLHAPIGLHGLAVKAHDLTSAAWKSMHGWEAFGISLSFILGEIFMPFYVNRALAARSPEASRAGFLMAAGFVLIGLGVVAALGIVAHAYLPADTQSDNVLLALGRAVLPAGLFGLLLATMATLIMSSAESLLNAASVSFVEDILGSFSHPKASVALLTAKIGTVIIAVLAIVLAQFCHSIIGMLLLLYAFWAPAILVSVIFGLYLRETKPLASWLSMIGGCLCSLEWQHLKEPGQVPAILVGVTGALVLYALGHLLGKRFQGVPAL